MIRLLNDYYRIDNCVSENDDTVWSITLLPEYQVYAGHFPGNPVSPGVCNIQMIKECVELATGNRLFLSFIAKCRFSAVLSPLIAAGLRLRATYNEVPGDGVKYISYNVHATLFDDNTNYMDFKGDFTTCQ